MEGLSVTWYISAVQKHWIIAALAIVVVGSYFLGKRSAVSEKGLSNEPSPSTGSSQRPGQAMEEPMMPVDLDVPSPGDSVEVELVESPADRYGGANLTESDRAYKAVVDSLLDRTLLYDANLGHAARELAVQHSLIGGLVPQHIVDFLLQAGGAIDRTVVQAYTATSGDDMSAVRTRLKNLIASQAASKPMTRIGIGEAYIPGAKRPRHIAILLSHRQIDTAPAARVVPLNGEWVMTGVLPPNFDDCSALVLRPDGRLTRANPTVVERRFTLSIPAGQQEGTLHISLGAEGPHGHAPLLQVAVEVGRAVPTVLETQLLPDEGHIDTPTVAEDKAFELINRDRKAHGLSPLM